MPRKVKIYKHPDGCYQVSWSGSPIYVFTEIEEMCKFIESLFSAQPSLEMR